MTLFPENETIRTLGFYQPFCSLMLHGKKETRWVREGRKPPFPLGKYLLYSTKKPCTPEQLLIWCGWIYEGNYIAETLFTDKTVQLNGYAIAIGELVSLRRMTVEDERSAFVKYLEFDFRDGKDGITYACVQWILEFENVQAIEPFKFNDGKQGVGILNPELHHKIKILV